MDISKLLIEIEKLRIANKASVIKKLQAGLKLEQIQNILEQLNIKNETVYDLYLWKNGISAKDNSPIEELELFPDIVLLP